MKSQISQVSQTLRWTKMGYISLVSLVFPTDRHLVILLRSHRDFCFVMSHHVTMESPRNDEVTLWFSCNLYSQVQNVKPPWALHCDVSTNNVTGKSLGFCLRWSIFGEFTVKSQRGIFCDNDVILYNCVTLHKTTIMVTLQQVLRITVTCESLDDFVVKLSGDSS